MTSNPSPIGAVFTPLNYARKTITDCGLYEKWLEGAKILDPTAGSGNFIEAFIKTAEERGDRFSPKHLENLYAVEMQECFVRDFYNNIQSRYGIDFPKDNFITGDYLFKWPSVEADYLVGNPPWLNFNDLEEEYKKRIKPHFIKSGLTGSKKELLLGNARIDIASLIVVEAIEKNLKKGGKAYFYLPLSLFLNDGAHKYFRILLQSGGLSLNRVEDFREYPLFPNVSTRYGFAEFTKGGSTEYPVDYRIVLEKGAFEDKKASPISPDGGPLIIHEKSESWHIPSIEITRDSKPRQGLNTCGANSLFIFDHREPAGNGLWKLWNKKEEALLPDELIYPLIGAPQFQEKEKHRYVFLPYNSNGKVMTEKDLSSYPEARSYLEAKRDHLCNRKGVLIGSAIGKGLWWSLLGIGPYSFAPWKVVWEAYGKKEFRPRVFSTYEGKVWQPNQALQAFLPFSNEDEAQKTAELLSDPQIEKILKSQGMEGTCNWAQPGRMMKFFRFKN